MQIRDLIPWGNKNEVSRQSEAGDGSLTALQRDINKAFDDFWKRFEQPSGGANGAVASFGPRADIADNGQDIEVSVELPGVDEKDIDVSLTNDVLTIRGERGGERKERKKDYYLVERSWGSFFRSIPLPAGVDTGKAEAEFKKGVLIIRLPKTPEAAAKVKKIEVKAA